MKFCLTIKIKYCEYLDEEQENAFIDTVIEKMEAVCGVDSEFHSVCLDRGLGLVIFGMNEFTSHQFRRFCDELEKIPYLFEAELDEIKLN